LERVCGPSFPPAIKIIATALVLALLAYAWRALFGPSGLQARELSATEWAFVAVVTVVIVSGYGVILTGRTTCDHQGIEQSGLWRKRVELAQITQIKLISIPGLSWLVVPRLVVRTGLGVTTFQAGDPAVLERFQLLAHGR
jgi:hypothetical protein